MLQYFPGTEDCANVCVLEGREAILRHARLLEAFAARCLQPGAMHWLAYFLDGEGRRWRYPYLVLVLTPEARLDALTLDDLRGAALFFEYRVLGIPTRSFATDDIGGMRSVVAPASRRSDIAALTLEAILRHGAHVALVSYDVKGRDANKPGHALRYSNAQWAQRNRHVRKQMDLGATYEETLALFGKSTRFNMRYYRKRLLAKLPCSFVADARHMLDESELAAINRGSLNPVTLEECLLRYRSACDLPGGFLLGLRLTDGPWLGLIGGWRQHDTTVLHWQLNAAGYEKDSLGTVMRAFFLQHEVEQGARRLIVYGGTSHSMQNSFEDELAWDLIVRRNSLWAKVLRVVARLVESPQGLTGRSNFLAAAMRSPNLDWKPTLPAQPAVNSRAGGADKLEPIALRRRA